MYKVKIFHNMGGVAAGKSLTQMVTNKDWWKGMLSNIVSTMVGICLTIGVAALVEYHNDKKLSREMMFNIIKVCEDNTDKIEEYDSLFRVQSDAIDNIVRIYYSTDEFKTISKEQSDSVQNEVNKILRFTGLYSTHAQVDKYFYSAQTLHQFGNPEVYADFADFVQLDHDTFSRIEKIKNTWIDIMQDISSSKANPKTKGRDNIAELIRSKKLSNYEFQMNAAMLKTSIQMYKDMFNLMLKVMGATKEEYEEYKESIDTGINNEYSYNEKIK